MAGTVGGNTWGIAKGVTLIPVRVLGCNGSGTNSGVIAGIDLNQNGKLIFSVPHGETPDNVKNNPALKGMTIPRTGRQGRIGVLTTKSLVIAGEGGFATTPNGRGAMLRAYDKASGNEVGAVYIPAPQTGSPMTYMLNGKQYITVSIAGPGYPGELYVLRLGN